jgi:formylglycine-generating enzyme required for sulfatase activity
VLEGEIEPRWIGSFLATPQADRGLRRFLHQQAEVYRRREASTKFSARAETLKPVERTRFYAPAGLPEGMVVIEGGEVEIAVTFTPREGGTYQTPHRRKVRLTPYAVDVTPVTNEQFEEFLRATGYKPRHAHNFLKHWTDGRIPEEKKDHPVVYVDLGDARAYARWAAKRLLTEEEWQYAAQGPTALKYPWRNEMKPGVCNDGSNTQDTTSVWAYREGRSPFGCYDMCGNTWEWMESERRNGRTRFCIIRSGSYFKAHGSWMVHRRRTNAHPLCRQISAHVARAGSVRHNRLPVRRGFSTGRRCPLGSSGQCENVGRRHGNMEHPIRLEADRRAHAQGHGRHFRSFKSGHAHAGRQSQGPVGHPRRDVDLQQSGCRRGRHIRHDL